MKQVTLSINAAAQALSISRCSVYALIRQERLKSVVIAGRRLVPVVEIDRLVAEAAQ